MSDNRISLQRFYLPSNPNRYVEQTLVTRQICVSQDCKIVDPRSLWPAHVVSDTRSLLRGSIVLADYDQRGGYGQKAYLNVEAEPGTLKYSARKARHAMSSTPETLFFIPSTSLTSLHR